MNDQSKSLNDSEGVTANLRFTALARRILTTPKSELVKHAAKGKRAKPNTKKRK